MGDAFFSHTHAHSWAETVELIKSHAWFNRENRTFWPPEAFFSCLTVMFYRPQSNSWRRNFGAETLPCMFLAVTSVSHFALPLFTSCIVYKWVHTFVFVLCHWWRQLHRNIGFPTIWLVNSDQSCLYLATKVSSQSILQIEPALLATVILST